MYDRQMLLTPAGGCLQYFYAALCTSVLATGCVKFYRHPYQEAFLLLDDTYIFLFISLSNTRAIQPTRQPARLMCPSANACPTPALPPTWLQPTSARSRPTVHQCRHPQTFSRSTMFPPPVRMCSSHLLSPRLTVRPLDCVDIHLSAYSNALPCTHM